MDDRDGIWFGMRERGLGIWAGGEDPLAEVNRLSDLCWNQGMEAANCQRECDVSDLKSVTFSFWSQSRSQPRELQKER